MVLNNSELDAAAYDTDGEMVTHVFTQNSSIPFDIEVVENDTRPLWAQILKMHEGSYLCRCSPVEIPYRDTEEDPLVVNLFHCQEFTRLWDAYALLDFQVSWGVLPSFSMALIELIDHDLNLVFKHNEKDVAFRLEELEEAKLHAALEKEMELPPTGLRLSDDAFNTLLSNLKKQVVSREKLDFPLKHMSEGQIMPGMILFNVKYIGNNDMMVRHFAVYGYVKDSSGLELYRSYTVVIKSICRGQRFECEVLQEYYVDYPDDEIFKRRLAQVRRCLPTISFNWHYIYANPNLKNVPGAGMLNGQIWDFCRAGEDKFTHCSMSPLSAHHFKLIMRIYWGLEAESLSKSHPIYLLWDTLVLQGGNPQFFSIMPGDPLTLKTHCMVVPYTGEYKPTYFQEDALILVWSRGKRITPMLQMEFDGKTYVNIGNINVFNKHFPFQKDYDNEVSDVSQVLIDGDCILNYPFASSTNVPSDMTFHKYQFIVQAYRRYKALGKDVKVLLREPRDTMKVAVICNHCDYVTFCDHCSQLKNLVGPYAQGRAKNFQHAGNQSFVCHISGQVWYFDEQPLVTSVRKDRAVDLLKNRGNVIASCTDQAKKDELNYPPAEAMYFHKIDEQLLEEPMKIVIDFQKRDLEKLLEYVPEADILHRAEQGFMAKVVIDKGAVITNKPSNTIFPFQNFVQDTVHKKIIGFDLIEYMQENDPVGLFVPKRPVE